MSKLETTDQGLCSDSSYQGLEAGIGAEQRVWDWTPIGAPRPGLEWPTGAEAALAVAPLAGGMAVMFLSYVVTERGWEKRWVRGKEPKW